MKTNNEKITREFCQDKELIFFPKTEEEAMFIQHRLFDMGYAWEGGKKVKYLSECISVGLVLIDERMYYKSYQDNRSYLLCSSQQFDENYMPPEQAFILDQFNKLAARIDAIAAKVDALYTEIMPKTLDKPVLKKREM